MKIQIGYFCSSVIYCLVSDVKISGNVRGTLIVIAKTTYCVALSPWIHFNLGLNMRVPSFILQYNPAFRNNKYGNTRRWEHATRCNSFKHPVESLETPPPLPYMGIIYEKFMGFKQIPINLWDGFLDEVSGELLIGRVFLHGTPALICTLVPNIDQCVRIIARDTCFSASICVLVKS